VRRSSTYVVVALAAALVGGLVALLAGQLTGITDVSPSTVYVPTSASDLGTGRGEPISHAKLLPANQFDPARIYAARSKGVVTVFAIYEEPDEHEAQGSGFIVSGSGYILTSAHVIIDTSTSKTIEARNVYVGFKDRDRIKATLVGWDVYDDVALLKVDPSAHALAPVPLGDSSRVRAGDPVAAMGSPFGNEDSITTGVV
jgi:S1-C subfamily serine protease